jgi:arylsulfatase A-like enzyme
MEKNATEPFRYSAALRLAAWFGLIAGFCEVLCLGVQKFLLRQQIYFGPHVIWMSPLANLCLFLLIGLLLGAFKIGSPRAKVALMSFLGLLGCALVFPQLKFYAMALLAAGGAWRAGLAVAANPWGFHRFTQRSLRWMFFGALALCAGVFGWQSHLMARASSQLSGARPDGMNVLLIVMDTVRARNLSLYGYERPTAPRLEQFAGTGVRFDRAIAAAPWTLTSHAAMFTGRFPHEVSADFRAPLDSAYPTLAEAMRSRGYLTAGFIANTFYCNTENGLARGFAHYEDYPVSASEFALSASLDRSLLSRDAVRRLIHYQDVIGRKSADDINQAFLGWVDRQKDRPFFAFLNYLDAHEPCLPPAPFDEKFGPKVRQSDFRNIHLLRTSWRDHKEKSSPQTRQADINCYDGAISYLDGQIGRLLDELERRGLRKNTLIIIAADHGEAFGENGHYGHIDSAYLTQLRVPLLISMPGVVPVGRVVTEPVSLRDMAATVTDLTGGERSFPGSSLARYWRETSAKEPESAATPVLSEINIAPSHPREYAPGTKAIITSLVRDRYHYLKNPDGRQELYDYISDPLEQRDLGGSAEHREILEGFSDFLRRQNERRASIGAD